MKNNFTCPSCGAALVFQSSLTVYAVCKYCGAMVVRHDLDVDSIGIMASLPADMSPFQIGTELTYQGRQFTLIGRRKIGWSDGVWNEWFLSGDEGHTGWLAEAQGFYAVNFALSEPLCRETEDNIGARVAKYKKNGGDLSDLNQQLGSYINVGGQMLMVVDIKQVVCIGSEGELPFIAPKDRATISIDLLGKQGEFGCIEIDADRRGVFLGQYVDWDMLQCQNLRSLEGW